MNIASVSMCISLLSLMLAIYHTSMIYLLIAFLMAVISSFMVKSSPVRFENPIHSEMHISQHGLKRPILKSIFLYGLLGLLMGFPLNTIYKVPILESLIVPIVIFASLLLHEVGHVMILKSFAKVKLTYVSYKFLFLEFIYGFFVIITDNAASWRWNALSGIIGPLVNLGLAFIFLTIGGPFTIAFMFNSVVSCFELFPISIASDNVKPSDGEVFAYYMKRGIMRTN